MECDARRFRPRAGRMGTQMAWSAGTFVAFAVTFLALAPDHVHGETPIPGGKWAAQGDVAYAPAMVATDGEPVALEVRCGNGRPWPVLRHPRLGEIPPLDGFWPGTAPVKLVLAGWNLDPRNPAHVGALTYWLACPGEAGCLAAAPVRRLELVRSIETEFSAFIRLALPGGSVTAHVTLAGSAAAIRAACKKSFPRAQE